MITNDIGLNSLPEPFELWRLIAGTNCKVSDQGRIERRGRKIETFCCDAKGYSVVKLKVDGRSRQYCVHTLVLTTFIGRRPAGLECRHLNGNKLDNRLENLAWGTRSANMRDRHFHGQMAHGERNGQAKLTWNDVEAIRQAEGPRGLGRRLAKAYGVSHQEISWIRTGGRWRGMRQKGIGGATERFLLARPRDGFERRKTHRRAPEGQHGASQSEGGNL